MPFQYFDLKELFKMAQISNGNPLMDEIKSFSEMIIKELKLFPFVEFENKRYGSKSPSDNEKIDPIGFCKKDWEHIMKNAHVNEDKLFANNEDNLSNEDIKKNFLMWLLVIYHTKLTELTYKDEFINNILNLKKGDTIPQSAPLYPEFKENELFSFLPEKLQTICK